MNGKSAGWTGLQLLVSWMKGLMGCGRNRQQRVIQMKKQYREWGWVWGGVATPPCMSYRSISSSSGVASPAIDMGVLSIMGLGDGRGVILCAFFRPSASFSFSHCSAILPQSTAEVLLPLGLQGGRREGEVVQSMTALEGKYSQLRGGAAQP